MTRVKKLVGGHKGKLTTRSNSAAIPSTRVDRLIQKHVTEQVEERQELLRQWMELRAAGVPAAAISEEYRVANSTVTDAIRNPDEWCQVKRYSIRDVGAKASRRKGSSTRPCQVQLRPERRVNKRAKKRATSK